MERMNLTLAIPQSSFALCLFVACQLFIAAALFLTAHDLAGVQRLMNLTTSRVSRLLVNSAKTSSPWSKFVYRWTLCVAFYVAIPGVMLATAYVVYGRQTLIYADLIKAVGLALVGLIVIALRPVQAISGYIAWLETELLIQNQMAVGHCNRTDAEAAAAQPQPIVAPTPAMARTLRGAASSISSATAGMAMGSTVIITQGS